MPLYRPKNEYVEAQQLTASNFWSFLEWLGDSVVEVSDDGEPLVITIDDSTSDPAELVDISEGDFVIRHKGSDPEYDWLEVYTEFMFNISYERMKTEDEQS